MARPLHRVEAIQGYKVTTCSLLQSLSSVMGCLALAIRGEQARLLSPEVLSRVHVLSIFCRTLSVQQQDHLSLMAFSSAVLLGFDGRTWFTVFFPTAFVVYWVTWAIYARTFHPLAKVPGPIWPSISRACMVYRAYAGDLDEWQRMLHEQYGPLVRVAPDEVLCGDPREIPKIYPISKPLEKTVWYDAWRPIGMPGRPDMYVRPGLLLCQPV
jgi:hypothetical protein